MWHLLYLTAALCCSDFIRGSLAASCSYPDQWAAEGVSFQPVRYFTNLPDCQKSTIFVHYPSKSMQIRSFKQHNGTLHEAGMWIFRKGMEGFSVNLPMFRINIPYTEKEKKHGLCDILTFRTGDGKAMAGAVEMHQHLTDLKPIKASDGSIKYYEKNFTSHQVLQLSMKLNKEQHPNEPTSSASNYLYSAFSHRVRIDAEGRCIPLSFQRYVYFGASCMSTHGLMIPNKEVPSMVEYFYAVKPASYRAGEIGKFDRTIRQLSCSNDFQKLSDSKEMVSRAIADGKCISADKLDFFIKTCCKMTYAEYKGAPECDLAETQLFKSDSKFNIWSKVCERRSEYENGSLKRVHRRDAGCKMNF